MSNKILTVIVPSYNMEKYLPKCLGSLVVAPELMDKLEVLVVNDGSKDRTSEIAHEFEAKYPQTFKVIDKPNGNYGSCINAALSVATGEFVRILDADDSFDIAHFEGFLRFVDKLMADVDVVISEYVSVNTDDEVVAQSLYGFDIDKVFSVEEMAAKTEKVMWMNMLTYRRCLFEKVGYKQTEGISYTDMEWNFVPMALAKKCVYYPYPIHRYLVGRDGQTTDREVFAKNLWMNAKVAQSLLNWGRSLNIDYTTIRGKYLARIIFSLLEAVYRFGLFSKSISNYDWLVAIEKEMQEKFPYFYYATDKWFLPNKTKFHYVREWRRKRSTRSLKFRLHHMYIACLSGCKRIMGVKA